MVKKQGFIIFAIIFGLIAVGVSLGFATRFFLSYRQQTSETAIKKEIEQAGYCRVDNDCTVLYAPCPFGCHAAVNKNEAGRIETLMNSFESTCVYSCIQIQGAKCAAGKCVVVP